MCIRDRSDPDLPEHLGLRRFNEKTLAPDREEQLRVEVGADVPLQVSPALPDALEDDANGCLFVERVHLDSADEAWLAGQARSHGGGEGFELLADVQFSRLVLGQLDLRLVDVGAVSYTHLTLP